MGHGCWHAVWSSTSINASLFTVHGATDATFDRADQVVHAAGKCLNVDVVWALAASHTQTLGCYSFAPGGLLRLSGGTTTLNSTPVGVSPTQQLFDTSAGGQIVSSGGVARVFVPWFGAPAAIASDFSGPIMAAAISVSGLGAAGNAGIPLDGAGLSYKVANTPVLAVSWEHLVNATIDFSAVAPYSGMPPSLVAAGSILQGSYGTPVPLQADVQHGSNEVVVATTDAANFTVGQDVSVTMQPTLPLLTAPSPSATRPSTSRYDRRHVLERDAAGRQRIHRLHRDRAHHDHGAGRPDLRGDAARGPRRDGLDGCRAHNRGGRLRARFRDCRRPREFDRLPDLGARRDLHPPRRQPAVPGGQHRALRATPIRCCGSTRRSRRRCWPERKGVQIGWVYPNTRPSHVTVSWNFIGPKTKPNGATGTPLNVGFYCRLADYVTFDGKTSYAWSAGATFESCNHWKQDTRALGLGAAGALATL